jgi:hypothetical protein
MANQTKFQKVASTIIDTLEGGYYHPNMLIDGRIKDSRYSASGETMFGIDRLKGGSINTTPDGVKFWAIIDKANASNLWKWNYMGGALKPTLQRLAANMILSLYKVYVKLYLKSPALAKIVENDDRLLFHLIYATWNGAGWFKKFATDLFNAYKKGTTNPNDLYRIALKSRTSEGLKTGSAPNSLIKQGGEKIAKLFENYKPNNPSVILIAAVSLMAYFMLKS